MPLTLIFFNSLPFPVWRFTFPVITSNQNKRAKVVVSPIPVDGCRIADDPKMELLKSAVSVSTLILIACYYWKGEAPNWKWKTIEKDKRKWH